jgi:hypothetical protein
MAGRQQHTAGRPGHLPVPTSSACRNSSDARLQGFGLCGMWQDCALTRNEAAAPSNAQCNHLGTCTWYAFNGSRCCASSPASQAQSRRHTAVATVCLLCVNPDKPCNTLSLPACVAAVSLCCSCGLATGCGWWSATLTLESEQGLWFSATTKPQHTQRATAQIGHTAQCRVAATDIC